MDVPAIAQVTFTSQDRVRDALHNSIWTGFDRAGAASPRLQPWEGSAGPKPRLSRLAGTMVAVGYHSTNKTV